MKRTFFCLFLLLLWLLAACAGESPLEEAAAPGQTGGGESTAAALPSPTAAPTAAPLALPTATTAVVSTTAPPPSPTPEAIATAALSPTPPPEAAVLGRTAEGAFFRGRADAPVTIIDYSDFL